MKKNNFEGIMNIDVNIDNVSFEDLAGLFNLSSGELEQAFNKTNCDMAEYQDQIRSIEMDGLTRANNVDELSNVVNLAKSYHLGIK